MKFYPHPPDIFAPHMPANTGARCWKSKKWTLWRKQADKQTNYAGINKPVDGLSSCGLPCHFWPTHARRPPCGSRGEITQQVKVSNTFFHFHRSIMEETSLSNNRLSKSLKTAKSTCEYANIRDQCAIPEFLKTCNQKPEDQESEGSANS